MPADDDVPDSLEAINLKMNAVTDDVRIAFFKTNLNELCMVMESWKALGM